MAKYGILLHPTSLPSDYGIGDLGRGAYNFLDFLKGSNQSLWQILPLNPVGFGYSPYQPFSAFAGNPSLIAIDKLLEEGSIDKNDITKVPVLSEEKVDYPSANLYKEKLLRKAYLNFTGSQVDLFNSFVANNTYWLEDYSLFIAIKKYFHGKPWHQWEPSIARRTKKAIDYYTSLLDEEIKYQKFLQYLFFTQWEKLRQYAHKNGINIIGDLPIFVAHDSSDVWANPDLFEIDRNGQPLKVAGVPPDYFSETGQLWGNPLYKWQVMEEDDYLWWRKRIELILKQVDIIRLDHFRGFVSYWEIPAEEKTAINGKWVRGPGEKFFLTLEKYLGKLPILAEDLGIITPDVIDLRERLGFPGMKILQFILESDNERDFLELFSEGNWYVYTGTHDNDTSLGWFKKAQALNPQIEKRIRKRLQITGNIGNGDIPWLLIKLAYKCQGKGVIIPLQDILGLDSSHRMNTPGTLNNNWQWRYKEEDLSIKLRNKLLKLQNSL